MRIILALLFSLAFHSLSAQIAAPFSFFDYTQRSSFGYFNRSGDSSDWNKKWHLSKYGGVSTSFGFFNGGNATILSAPVGLQLNRRLNNNLYAFAGLSAAPAYMNFNSTFSHRGFNQTLPNGMLMPSNGFGIHSRAEMGLMYINDAKTFSISGSIGVERRNYPAYPLYQPNKNIRQPVTGSRP